MNHHRILRRVVADVIANFRTDGQGMGHSRTAAPVLLRHA